jgi:hypothetical protein
MLTIRDDPRRQATGDRRPADDAGRSSARLLTIFRPIFGRPAHGLPADLRPICGRPADELLADLLTIYRPTFRRSFRRPADDLPADVLTIFPATC